jgi:hypothetical protein
MPLKTKAQKGTRGKARPNKQVSALQRSIVYWVYLESQRMLQNPDSRLMYEELGVLWQVREVLEFVDVEINYHSSSVILSKSLTRLESRGLVYKFKRNGITKRVKLTPLGVRLAVIHSLELLRKSEISKLKQNEIKQEEKYAKIYQTIQLLPVHKLSQTRVFTFVIPDLAALFSLKTRQSESRHISFSVPDDWPLESEDDFIAYMMANGDTLASLDSISANSDK